MTNRKLRKDLLQKLGFTKQALSSRVQKLKRQYSMTTEDAVYLIAQQSGIILDKYLDKATIDRIRILQTQLNSGVPPKQTRVTVRSTNKSTDNNRIIIIGKEIKLSISNLSKQKIVEAKEMASIYPLIYILENSIRVFIENILKNIHGDGWFQKTASKSLRDTVEQRTKDENSNLWHQRRGASPLDYLDLSQLVAIARKIPDDIIKQYLPSVEWLSQLIDEVYRSRCVICHMNPLDKDNIQAVKLRLRQWVKQLKLE